MKVLLDTCTLLWLANDDPQLSLQAREVFSNPDNDVYLSLISTWEIVLKHANGRLILGDEPKRYIPSLRQRYHINALAINEEEIFYLPHLPHHHKDPFDRLLIAQSVIYGMAILTPDPKIAQYTVRVIW